MNITEKFINLINLKQEGSYWDFKKAWYSHDIDKKSDLVHDIICMANNQVDLETYIFIGIEDKTFEIIGVDNDLNRWNTQNLVDLMKNLKFYGDVRPIVTGATPFHFLLFSKVKMKRFYVSYIDIIKMLKNDLIWFISSFRFNIIYYLISFKEFL